MRILVLTSSYPKFKGDSTAPFIELVTAEVAELGHEVHVVVPEHRDWARPPVEDGIHYHVARYSPRHGWTPWGFSEALQGGDRIRPSLYAIAPAVFMSTVRTCLAVARTTRFDLIHAHWAVPNGLVAGPVHRHLDIPLVISLHGSDVAIAERSRWIGPLARRSLSRSAAITGASRHTLARAEALGVPPDALELVPYGTDLDRFAPNLKAAGTVRELLGLGEHNVMVLGAGRLVAVKGFEYAIEAMATVHDAVPGVRFVLAGDGALRDELEAKTRQLGLEEVVVFAGDVGRTDIPSYFAAADIIIVPSIRHPAGFTEALGNVALEAMAAGRPVIASRVGGLPEVVRDGETGVLVEDRQPEALARAIVDLARDPPLRLEFGANARRTAETSLSWRASAERLVEVYERAVAR